MGPERLWRAREALVEHGIDVLLVGPGPDLRYLIGYDPPLLERLTMLVVPAQGQAHLIVPELELPRAEHSPALSLVGITTWSETDDAVPLVGDLVGDADRVAVQDRLWATFLLRLQAALPGVTWSHGSEVMRDLRMVKDDDEIEALRAVAVAIDTVHARVPELLRVGRREVDVAHDIAELILEDHDRVNFVIVASGPNGASPHHEPGDRRLQPGDAVVVDIGGTRNGYCSDATRDYAVGWLPDGYAEMHAVLEEAQAAATQAVRPGATAGEVDEAARSVIRDAGYGDAFVHRTGHGIGLEEHEEPWIVAGNPQPLRAGMAFSIEPGIYLPGRFGARIEDIVLVTDDGVESLNTVRRRVTVCPT